MSATRSGVVTAQRTKALHARVGVVPGPKAHEGAGLIRSAQSGKVDA